MNETAHNKNTATVLGHYVQPAFLLCVLVLAIAGSGMSVAIKSFGVYLEKEPLPLAKSFELLDENGLAHYRIVRKDKIQNEEVVQSLGTTDYIQWHLEDTQADPTSPTRYCLLFITYYENADRVPHVPEACYTGGGHQMLASEAIKFPILRQPTGETVDLPGRYLVFSGIDSSPWASNTKFSVLYLFSVNGVYTASREDTRLVMNKNIFGKHSYFSKVELKFFNMSFGSKIYPDKEQAVEASQRLLNVILPILENEHWPEMPE